jgi:hypothetical protein
MEALVHLRPAAYDDLIDGGFLVPNRIYFERSIWTGRLEGPYVTPEQEKWIKEAYCKIHNKMVFVPHYEPTADSICCTMVFKEAVPADLKSFDLLKYNYSYYLMLGSGLSGPFMITRQTNVNDLRYYLTEKRVFVLEHKSAQHFKELNTDKKAS